MTQTAEGNNGLPLAEDLAASSIFSSSVGPRELQDSSVSLDTQEEGEERGPFVPPADGWSWDGAQQLCLGERQEGRWPGICF